MPQAMTVSTRPVLGMLLKGYPRISETFISNEILLLEQLGFAVHIFSMRRGRESFTHESVARIRAGVDYLPETFLRYGYRLLYHNLCLAMRQPRRYAAGLAVARRRFMRNRNPASLRHFLQAGYLVQRCLPSSGVVHLHAHFAHSPASVALYASVLSGLPFSFTAHAKDIYTSDTASSARRSRWRASWSPAPSTTAGICWLSLRACRRPFTASTMGSIPGFSPMAATSARPHPRPTTYSAWRG